MFHEIGGVNSYRSQAPGRKPVTGINRMSNGQELVDFLFWLKLDELGMQIRNPKGMVGCRPPATLGCQG
jgi:hypothetical protein